MKNYYITFGSQYAREPHPHLDIHPDGYVTIIAPDRESARQKAFELTNGRFSFMYGDEDMEFSYFPMGSLMTVQANAVTGVTS